MTSFSFRFNDEFGSRYPTQRLTNDVQKQVFLSRMHKLMMLLMTTIYTINSCQKQIISSFWNLDPHNFQCSQSWCCMSVSRNLSCPNGLSTWRNMKLRHFIFSWLEHLLVVIPVIFLDDQLKLGLVELFFYLFVQVFDRMRRRSGEQSVPCDKILFQTAGYASHFKRLTSFTDSHLLTDFKTPFWLFRLVMKQLPSNSLFIIRSNHGRFDSHTHMMRVIVRVDEILKDVDISKTLWVGKVAIHARL